MSDRDVTALLDRVAARTPAMDVSVPGVVATGRRRVRRRHALSSGMALASVLLLVAVWVGLGRGGPGLLGSQEVGPAGTWEVDEPSPIELPEGLQLVGGMQPLTLSRGPAGSSATFVVDGITETAAGRTLGEGVEVYAGLRGTMVVWEAGTQGRVWPDPEAATSGSADVTVAGERLSLWTTDAVGYEPDEVLFFDRDSVRTAAGATVDTAELTDGRVAATAFDIPDLDTSGYLDGTDLYEVDTLTVASVDRPWWRGGGYDVTTVARLPREAVYAREVLRDPDGSEVVRASEPQVAALVGRWSMVLFVSDWAGGGPESQDLLYDIEWSTDGQTWHEQPLELEADPADDSGARADGAVGPGGEVTLLGESYRVALDQHGWPLLLDADGSVFLTVSDVQGPPAGDGGGIVMWREHWWPWSDRNEVHFRLDGRPALMPGVEGQDAVTVSGPAGEIGLVAVPAGS